MYLRGRFYGFLVKKCPIFILFKYQSTIYTVNVENIDVKLYKKNLDLPSNQKYSGYLLL